MLKRILAVWLIANFIIVGVVSCLAGGWYLERPSLVVLVAEVGLIMVPNVVLPLWVLRHYWPVPVHSLRNALGWTWNGWRSIVAGGAGVGLTLLVSRLILRGIGESIPYQIPGREGAVGPVEDVVQVVGLLLLVLGTIVITVAGEETLFRGLVQTQVGQRYGGWVGLLLGAVLFGLRHLPADIFYARAWRATPQMWLARQLELYSFALVLGLARRYGRSTYAPAITHGLIFLTNLFE